jgi:hypothetical protein
VRPLALRLDGYPTPGICAGLLQALAGMRVGGRRTAVVPAGLAFGASPAAAPYGIVPGGAAVRYEIELLRLSRRGPDALFKVRPFAGRRAAARGRACRRRGCGRGQAAGAPALQAACTGLLGTLKIQYAPLPPPPPAPAGREQVQPGRRERDGRGLQRDPSRRVHLRVAFRHH